MVVLSAVALLLCFVARRRGFGRGGARSQGYWLTAQGRRLNLDEMARLQGMGPEEINQAVSDTQYAKMLGGAMPQNVLERTLHNVLISAGLATKV